MLGDHHSHVVLCSSMFTNLALFCLGDKDVTKGKDVSCGTRCAGSLPLPAQAWAEEVTLVMMLSASRDNAGSKE